MIRALALGVTVVVSAVLVAGLALVFGIGDVLLAGVVVVPVVREVRSSRRRRRGR